MRPVLIIATTAALLFGTAACTLDQVNVERESVMISAAYDAVDALLARQAKSPIIGPGSNRRILVATAVDLNNLTQSSPFGRLFAEQMASRFAQLGIPVSELKLTGNLFVSAQQGELVLSRAVKDIGGTYEADAIVVTTYVDASSEIFVTTKLVRASDSLVLGAYNFSIKKIGPIASLLGQTGSSQIGSWR